MQRMQTVVTPIFLSGYDDGVFFFFIEAIDDDESR